MTTIIPIPAFSGQLHLGRCATGARAAVVDPGDAAPVLAWLDASGARAGRDPRHASSRRPRRRHRGALRALRRARVRPRARNDSGAHARARAKATASTCPGIDARARGARHSGPHGRAHRVRRRVGGDAGAVLRRHAVRRGLRPAVRGHARPDVGVACRSSRRLPAATRVYCGHEYTLANLRFARGGRARQRRRCARGARATRRSASAAQPTLPSTIGDERATNPFLRAGDAATCCAAARGACGRVRWRRRRRRSRRCARGRTTSGDVRHGARG